MSKKVNQSFSKLVGLAGVEPARFLKPLASEANMTTNFNTARFGRGHGIRTHGTV